MLPILPPNRVDAAVSSYAQEDIPVPNDFVTAIESAPDGSTYVGGNFTAINSTLQRYQATFTQSGELLPTSISAMNSTIISSVADGAGGWYVGGNFTSIDGVPYGRIAHIASDGSVVSAFNPNVINGQVSALALSSDGSTLYAGGSFTTVNGGGTTRNRLAAFSTTTGIATSFDPNVSGTVRDIKLNSLDDTLFVGGDFTTVNGATARNRLASFSTATSTATSFNPNVSAGVYSLAYDEVSGMLYAGGNFTTVNGATSRNRLASFNISTSTATGFNPNTNGISYSLALNSSGSTIFAGGVFTTVNGGTSRLRLAAFSTTTGTVTAFNPNVDNQVNSIAFSADGNSLVLGGSFTTVNGSTARNRMAVVDVSTGLATSFNPNMSSTINTISIDQNNDNIFAGGNFESIGGTSINRLIKLDANGDIVSGFNPNISGSSIYDIEVSDDSSTVYVAGLFTTVNGSTTRNGLAAFDTTTGIATAFNPNPGSGGVVSMQLDDDSDLLYVGGVFTTVNGGTSRNRMAAFDTNTGLANSFDPNIPNTVEEILLTGDGSTVYATGWFSEVNGGTARNNIAAFDTSTSNATNFDPGLGSVGYSLALSSTGDTIYVGGFFTSVNGSTSRNRLAAFDTSTGIATGFNPNISGTVLHTEVSEDDSLIYIGGHFSTVNGSTARNGIAVIDTATGLATGFDPNLNSSASAISINRNTRTLYAGGQFTTVAGESRPYLAAFADPDFDNDGITNLIEDGGPNAGDANGDNIFDSSQPNVASLLSASTSEYMIIETQSGTTLSSAASTSAPEESGFTHLYDLTSFTLSNLIEGGTTDVMVILPNPNSYDHADFVARKYFPDSESYRNIDNANFSADTIGGSPVVKLSYTLTDGGEFDLDGAVDGSITDPVGVAIPGQDTEPETLGSGSTLAATGANIALFMMSSLLLIVSGLKLFRSQQMFVIKRQ
jgi:hypothetical protein